MLIVIIKGLNLKFLMKFSLCVIRILKVTRMLKKFHLCELKGGATSHESWSFSQESS